MYWLICGGFQDLNQSINQSINQSMATRCDDPWNVLFESLMHVQGRGAANSFNVSNLSTNHDRSHPLITYPAVHSHPSIHPSNDLLIPIILT